MYDHEVEKQEMPQTNTKPEEPLADVFVRTFAFIDKSRYNEVKERGKDLRALSQVFIERVREDELADRLKTYYLPALEKSLHALSEAEKIQAKSCAKLKDACIRAMDVIEYAMRKSMMDDCEEDAQLITAEIDAMHSFAVMRDDIDASHQLTLGEQEPTAAKVE